jgi:predicted ester cyclase
MTLEENLRVADAATKALNDHDLDQFESYHSESVKQTDPISPEPIIGPKAIRAELEPFLKAFPDLTVVLERKLGQGDWISVQGHMAGTHTAPLESPGGPPVPATNRRMKLPYAFIAKVLDGKFEEVHVYFDQMGMMAQLGIMPPPSSEAKT